MDTLQRLMDRLWEDYARLNPQASAIHRLLGDRGETVINDHIAFRTFDDARIGIDVLARPFLEGGYEPKGEYVFSEKRLVARHYEPSAVHRQASSKTPHLPRIFISELKVSQFSQDFAHLVRDLINQVPDELPHRWDFPVAGRPWCVSYDAYEKLRSESEYGAWLGAFGFRANHFTIDVGALTTFQSLEQFNTFVELSGFKLNTGGGRIKGSPQTFLEQSSTLAAHVPVEFVDGTYAIPCCYYEFAKRYPMPDGQFFQGFVAGSADKIFESTNRRDR